MAEAYVDDRHMAALQADPPYGNVNRNVGIIDQDQVDGFRSFLVSHDIVGTSGLLPADYFLQLPVSTVGY